MRKVDLKKTALVLIDLQKESKYGIEGLEEIVANTRLLVDTCRSLGVPVIYTRQINREDGVALPFQEPLNVDGKPIFYCTGTEDMEVIDDIAPEPGDIVIDKYRWSGFYETSLDLTLRSLGVKHLVIGGLVTDGCLMTSVFDGFFRDYQVNLVKDISGATNSGAHMASIMIMANWVYGIKIYDTEELLKQWKGEDYFAWEATGPDQLQFTPENMREVFQRLNK